METSELIYPGLCLGSTPKNSYTVEKGLESLQRELKILELFSEVYSNEEQQKNIRLKRSQIGQLQEILEKLYVVSAFHFCLRWLKIKCQSGFPCGGRGDKEPATGVDCP